MTSCLVRETGFVRLHVHPHGNNSWRGEAVLLKCSATGGKTWYLNACSLALYLTVTVTEAVQCRMVSRGVQSVRQDMQGNVSPIHDCLARPLNLPSFTIKVVF